MAPRYLLKDLKTGEELGYLVSRTQYSFTFLIFTSGQHLTLETDTEAKVDALHAKYSIVVEGMIQVAK